SEELDRIAAAITSQPGGIGIEALLERLDAPLSRRTLQRRLATLVAQGRIQATGEGRAARYRSVHRVGIADSQLVNLASPASIEIYVPTSPESRDIRAQIDR